MTARLAQSRTPARTARILDAVVFCNFLALGIVVAAVPRYLHSVLNASRVMTGLATTIYFLAALLTRPFLGPLTDRRGRRLFITCAPLITAGFTLTYLKVHSIGGVTALRFFGGGVAAFFFTSVTLALTDIVEPSRRTQALSRQSVMTYSGFAVGPIIAEWLIGFSWTAVWIGAAALHVVTACIAFSIGETRSAEAISAPPSTTGLDRRVVKPAMAVLAANFGFSTLVAFLPEYSEHLHITRPGYLFATYAVAVMVVRGATGSVADRVGPARFTLPLLTIGALSLFALGMARAPWQAFVAIACAGGSLGATFPAGLAGSLARVPAQDRGKALSTTFALGDIGQAVAGPLVGFLSSKLGIVWLFGIPGAVCVLAIVAISSLPEVRPLLGRNEHAGRP